MLSNLKVFCIAASFVGYTATAELAIPGRSCLAKTQKSVSLSSVDLSAQIQNRPRAADEQALKPRVQPDYETLSRAYWSGLPHAPAAWLSVGADPNVRDAEGTPIIFYAIAHGNVESLEDLLQAGANPNLTRKDSTTPLGNAIWYGDPKKVSLLLEYGADPALKSGGKTSVEHAKWHERADIVAILSARPAKAKKPAPPQLPKVLRHPTATFGTADWSCAGGGQAIVYSPDSRQLIAGDSRGGIRIYDAHTGRVQHVFDGGRGDILGLCFLPDSRILVSACEDDTVRFWNFDSREEIKRLKLHTNQGKSFAVSPDGRYLSTGSHLWKIESTKPLQLAAEGRENPARSALWCCFSPDSRFLISGSDKEQISVYEVATGKQQIVKRLAERPLKSITWGDLAATVDIGRANKTDLLAIVVDQYTILAATPALLRASEQAARELSGNSRAMACSPNGQYVASVGYSSRIEVADSENRRRITYEGHAAGLQCVAASPDGRWIASGGDDKTVRIWNRETRAPVELIETGTYVYSVRFSPDSKLLAIGDNNGRAYLWDLSKRKLSTYDVGGRITDLLFDPKGSFLAVLGYELHLLDLETQQLRTKVSSGSAQQGKFAYSPRASLFVGSANSMAAGETFKVPEAWTLDGNEFFVHKDLFTEQMGHRSFIQSLAFSPDEKLLAASSNFAIRLWDVKGRKPIGGPLVGNTYSVNQLQFDPTGRWLASAGGDGAARVWEVATGRQAFLLDADVYAITGVDFTPGGEVVTANWDGTVHLWELPGVAR